MPSNTSTPDSGQAVIKAAATSPSGICLMRGAANDKVPEVAAEQGTALEQGAKALDPGKWVIVCCASGTRSALAGRKLRSLGCSRVLNAGSWRNLP
mgnify:CR=1 FL=1